MASLWLLSSVQSLSCVRLFAASWTAAHQASLSITKPQSLLKLMSIKSVMPSNHLIFCHPLLLPPSIFPSIRVWLLGEGISRIPVWGKYPRSYVTVFKTCGKTDGWCSVKIKSLGKAEALGPEQSRSTMVPFGGQGGKFFLPCSRGQKWSETFLTTLTNSPSEGLLLLPSWFQGW